MINVQKYRRMGVLGRDFATGVNPCGESFLEDKETCNLVEDLLQDVSKTIWNTILSDENGNPPEFTVDNFDEDAFMITEYATFYASTVALLPTHRPETNKVVARNRRIGVSLSGIADWITAFDNRYTEIIRILDKAYNTVEQTNIRLARDAGVEKSIRLTVIKPSGTISQLVGVSNGIHFPEYSICYETYEMCNK